MARTVIALAGANVVRCDGACRSLSHKGRRCSPSSPTLGSFPPAPRCSTMPCSCATSPCGGKRCPSLRAGRSSDPVL